VSNAPGIRGRKGKGRATERARLTGFDGPGTGVDGSSEGRDKATSCRGESVDMLRTKVGLPAVPVDCCVFGYGNRGPDCAPSIGAEGIGVKSSDLDGPDRGEDLVIRIFGDFLRGWCIDCGAASGTDRDEGCVTKAVRRTLEEL
jgi:hypothetical protein